MAVRERAWDLDVPHHAFGARLARQQLATDLHGLIAPNLLGDVVAVVAELLGNAVRHASPLPGGVIRLVLRIGPAFGAEQGYVVLRVIDGGADRVPAPRLAGPESVDGRGLAIVTALARRWGVERDGERQCVWAEMGTPRP